MEYVVVGAGAIGGTIGARLARDGHDVLLCDADPEHVAAINDRGLTIEGPVEQFTRRSTPVTPWPPSRHGSRRTALSFRSRMA